MNEQDVPSRHKRYRLAVAVLMDELDVEQMVLPVDHMETVQGGVQIDYDRIRGEFVLTRFTGQSPASLGNRNKQVRRALGKPI